MLFHERELGNSYRQVQDKHEDLLTGSAEQNVYLSLSPKTIQAKRKSQSQAVRTSECPQWLPKPQKLNGKSSQHFSAAHLLHLSIVFQRICRITVRILKKYVAVELGLFHTQTFTNSQFHFRVTVKSATSGVQLQRPKQISLVTPAEGLLFVHQQSYRPRPPYLPNSHCTVHCQQLRGPDQTQQVDGTRNSVSETPCFEMHIMRWKLVTWARKRIK
jgi:hypothetical protein